MAQTLERLVLKIEADSRSMRRDLARAEAQLRRSGGAMSRELRVLEARVIATQVALSGLKAAVVAIAGAAALGALTKRSLDAADAIAKVADSIGLSTDALQELRFAADLSGVSADLLDRSLQTFGKRLGEAREGTGALAEFLKKGDQAFLGVVSSARSTDEALDLVLKRMAATTDEANRAALAAAAFGRAGVKMTNLVRDGAKGLAAMRAEARELGIVLDEQMLRAAEAANDQLTRMESILSANLNRLLIGLAPTIIEIGKAFADAAPKIKKFIESFLPDELAGVDELERRLEAVRMRKEELKAEFDALGEAGFAGISAESSAQIRELEAQEKVLEALIKAARLREKTLDAAGVTRPAHPKVVIGGTPEQRKRAFALADTLLTPQQRAAKALAQRMKELNELVDAGALSWRTYGKLVARAQEEFNQAAGSGVASIQSLQTATDDLRSSVEEMGRATASAFEDMIVQGRSAREVLRGLVQDLQRSLLRRFVTKPAGDLFGKALSALFSGGGGAESVALSLTGPRFQFAAGGRPPVGEPSLVGERGPELFVPDRPGTIVPNDRLGGTVVINQRFDFRGASLEAAALLRREAERIKRETLAAITESAERGGRLARLPRV